MKFPVSTYLSSVMLLLLTTCVSDSTLQLRRKRSGSAFPLGGGFGLSGFPAGFGGSGIFPPSFGSPFLPQSILPGLFPPPGIGGFPGASLPAISIPAPPAPPGPIASFFQSLFGKKITAFPVAQPIPYSVPSPVAFPVKVPVPFPVDRPIPVPILKPHFGILSKLLSIQRPIPSQPFPIPIEIVKHHVHDEMPFSGHVDYPSHQHTYQSSGAEHPHHQYQHHGSYNHYPSYGAALPSPVPDSYYRASSGSQQSLEQQKNQHQGF